MLDLGISNVSRKTEKVTLGSIYLEALSLEALADKVQETGVAFNNLVTIRRTIKKYGFTKSVEALVGREQASHASMEGIKSAWDTFVQWCKNAWNSFMDFFRRLFNAALSMKKKLEDKKKKFEAALKSSSGSVKISLPKAMGEFFKNWGGISSEITRITNDWKQVPLTRDYDADLKKIEEKINVVLGAETSKDAEEHTVSDAAYFNVAISMCDTMLELRKSVDAVDAKLKTMIKTPNQGEDVVAKAKEMRKAVHGIIKGVSKLTRAVVKCAGSVLRVPMPGAAAK